MSRPKIYKFIALVMLAGILAASVYYVTMPNRHKAIVKTTLLHSLHLTDPEWMFESSKRNYQMLSPTFLIDGIYKSMEGPKSSRYLQLTPDSTLVWLTGFSVQAVDADTRRPISNDFVCHMNVDFNDVAYFSSLGLDERIGKQYPRMTSLSHGMEQFALPEGFGIPMQGNQLLFVTTQTLNHNLPHVNQKVKHKIDINYTPAKLKPLMSRTAFIMLPYDRRNPFKEPTDPSLNQCIPVETKNHSYDDGNGNMLSGHWMIPPGKKTYRSGINNQLQITDSLRLHAAAIHVHPFATSISIYDKTLDKPVFTSKVVNHDRQIGLTTIEPFSSEEGIWLYGDHQYEMVLEVHNTSNEPQDMMGSMFLFFYDEQLDRIISDRLR